MNLQQKLRLALHLLMRWRALRINISKAPSATATVKFVDLYGRPFVLTTKDCSSISSTRTLVAEEFQLDRDSFDFWAGKSLITSCMWTTQVRPGAKIVLRPSPTSGSPQFYTPSISLPPPPPPSPTPGSTSTSTSAPLLGVSEIWTAKGLHTLPFAGCGNRIFRFYSHSIFTSLGSLGLYHKLRERAPPERWSDLHGNVVRYGCVTAADIPQVNIGPISTDRLSKLPGVTECTYVLVRGATITISRGKHISAHLDGDSIYQWVSYRSLEHAQAGLVESLSLGYSIIENWVELDIPDDGREKLDIFDDGLEKLDIPDDGREKLDIFDDGLEKLDISDDGWEKLAQLCGKKIVIEEREIFCFPWCSYFKEVTPQLP